MVPIHLEIENEEGVLQKRKTGGLEEAGIEMDCKRHSVKMFQPPHFELGIIDYSFLRLKVSRRDSNPCAFQQVIVH